MKTIKIDLGNLECMYNTKVKKTGNGGYITARKKYIGKEVIVIITKKEIEVKKMKKTKEEIEEEEYENKLREDPLVKLYEDDY